MSACPSRRGEVLREVDYRFQVTTYRIARLLGRGEVDLVANESSRLYRVRKGTKGSRTTLKETRRVVRAIYRLNRQAGLWALGYLYDIPLDREPTENESLEDEDDAA